MVKAGIINVTGYAGVELARILARHPEVEITSVTGRSAAGKKLSEVFPHLSAIDRHDYRGPDRERGRGNLGASPCRQR